MLCDSAGLIDAQIARTCPRSAQTSAAASKIISPDLGSIPVARSTTRYGSVTRSPDGGVLSPAIVVQTNKARKDGAAG